MGFSLRYFVVVSLCACLPMGVSSAVTYCSSVLNGVCRPYCLDSGRELTFSIPVLCMGVDGTYCCVPTTTTTSSTTSTTTATTTTSSTTTTPIPTTTKPSTPACGVYTTYPSPKIIGGIQAARCEFPWMVRMYLPYNGGPCGAALIDNRHIITAAHCPMSGGPLEVTVGEYNTSEIRPQAKITFYNSNFSTFVNAGYNSTFYYDDLAIIKLTDPLQLSSLECVSPICLPSPGYRFPSDTPCIVAGWGVTSTQYGTPPSKVLRKVEIPIVNDTYCIKEFNTPGQTYFTSKDYCAGFLDGGRDSCGGDSGGPLMCLKDGIMVLAGVVSVGRSCAVAGVPAIYKDVAQYVDWINNIVSLP